MNDCLNRGWLEGGERVEGQQSDSPSHPSIVEKATPTSPLACARV